MDLGGITTIALIIRRVRQAKKLDGIVVATTANAADNALAAAAIAEGVSVYRGSEADVLGRVMQAHAMMNSDVVVELCGDCPMIDPEIIDRAITRYHQGDCDLVTTTSPQSYPQGMDVEVFARGALQEVNATIWDPAVREHVSLHFYRNRERYRIANLGAPASLAAPTQRLQLDYNEDLQVLRKIHEALAPVHGEAYNLADILAWLEINKSVREINRHCVEKTAQ